MDGYLESGGPAEGCMFDKWLGCFNTGQAVWSHAGQSAQMASAFRPLHPLVTHST